MSMTDIFPHERDCSECDGAGQVKHDCGEDACPCADTAASDCEACDGCGTVLCADANCGHVPYAGIEPHP